MSICKHVLTLVLFLTVLSVAMLPPAAWGQQVLEGEVVLQEVPLALEAPGFYRYVSAYHDGASFYVDLVALFEALGFDVRLVPPVVEALDATRTYTINFAEGTARRAASETTEVSLAGEYLAGAGRYYVTMAGLSRVFESDIYFEEERLSLRLSTAADRFDVGALRGRHRLLSQAPGPLRFGRDRRLLGGVMLSYHVSRHQVGDQPGLYQGNLSFTGSLLGGSLRGDLRMLRRMGLRRPAAHASSLSYLFDRPGSRFLTRFEVGRFGQSYWNAPEPLEALRLSNLPLASRYLQRESRFSGRAEPHALVEAIVSGVVVDRVQADEQGRYRVVIPTFYGSTEALVRTTPLGAALPREERRFLFATDELAEPGRLYYDAYLGRTRQTRRPVGLAHVQYGLLPRLSVRAAGLYYDEARRARLGAAFSPFSFSVLSADVDLPSGRLRGDMKVWHSRMSMEATYEHNAKASLFSTNRRLFQSQITASSGQLSGFVALSLSEGFQGWSHRRISPALNYYSPGGITADFVLTAQRTRAGSGTRTDGYTYRASLGKTFFLRGGSSRLSLFARGTGRRTLGESGVEGFLSFRDFSLGFSAGYSFLDSGFTGGLTLRLDSSLGGFSSRGAYSGSALSHEESVYGSIEVSRHPRLSRGVLQGSSAVLRVFEDLDGDGRYRPGEPIRPEVEVQLYQAGLERRPGGTLRAGFLQPYGVYQVQIIERSIRDPLLTPATGYTFSFIADPGRTREIDIPLQRMPVVTGIVRGLEMAPSRLRLLVFKGDRQVETADLYRDGGFTLRLSPGPYELRLIDVVTGRSFPSGGQSIFVAPGTQEPLVLELTVDRGSDE